MEISWNPSLKIGHELIDSQHIELFGLFDEFIDGCTKGAGKETLLQLHQSLKDYTLRHFQAEEGLMKNAGYPGLENHQRDHQRFKDDLAAIRTQISQQGPTLMALIQTNKALVSWLTNHVQEKDQKFGDFLENSKSS